MVHPSVTWWAFVIAALPAAIVVSAARAPAQTVASELKALKQEIEALRRSEAEKQRRLNALEERIEKLQAESAASTPASGPQAVAAPPPAPPAVPVESEKSALDRAIEALAPQRSDTQTGDLWSRQVGGTKLRLIDISFDTLLAAGTSTATDGALKSLEGGGHDPDRRGFTLQQAELSFNGAVDPYLTGEAHIVFTDDGVELEEALMTTTSLPYQLQVKAGYFLTEFGIINPLHPHAWDWIDQPVVNTRMFGGDGLRSPGVRLGWLAPLPWYSLVAGGVQNSNQGETTASFIAEEPVGGRPSVSRGVHSLEDMLYVARWENFVNLSETTGATLGFSGLYGPNNTGSDGDTWIYGTDLKVRWRPADNFRGWPFLIWQTEAMKRDYTASSFVAGTGGEDDGADTEEPDTDIPGAILRDWGLYTQILYGFHYRWAAGVRFDYASGHGESVGGRSNDPFRDDRYRFSPLLVWQPTEFSRFRLQYNYDIAKNAPVRDASTVWIGGEISYGMHPAHKY